MWLLANGWELKLKALSNDHFSLILLNQKRGRNGRLIDRSRKVKVGTAFSEDIFLIIWSYWPNHHYLETGIGIYRNNHIRKNRDNFSINITDVDRNRGAENSGIGTEGLDKERRVGNIDISIANADRDKKVDNLGTNTVNIDRDERADNPSTGTADKNGADNIGISIVDIDRDRGIDDRDISTADADEEGKADNPGISIADPNRVEDPSTGRQPDERAIASNTACASLFSLRKALFFMASFFKLEIIGCWAMFLFNFSLLSSYILIQ